MYGGTFKTRTYTQTQTQTNFRHSKKKNCVAVLVRIDYGHNEINSNIDRRLGGNSNGVQCQPCDADAIDGEDSPLQSKRSSRF